MKNALFLDRDGIFNELVYRNGVPTAPRTPEELRLCHDFDGQVLSEIKKLGFLLVLVTNQPDIERGLVSQKFVEDVLQDYQKRFGLDALYYCPFSSDNHPWKKPNPGMFLQAAQDLSLTLSECFHLGDTVRDIGAARRCGCRSLLWRKPYNRDLIADFSVNNLQEVRSVLVAAKSNQKNHTGCASSGSLGWGQEFEFHKENLSAD